MLTEKSFEGSLARVEVPDVFTFVNMGRRTGLLLMGRGREEIKIYFREGEPFFAGSNREDLRLSTMLVRAGKLSAQDVERAVKEHHSEGDRIGQAFIRAGVIDADELTAFLKVQTSEVIFATFDWPEGTFTFYDEVIPADDAVALELSLQNLVMEGVRRIDERGRVSERFANLDMVVELAENADRVKQRLTLTPEEWRILFLVNGRRTLAELCRLAGSDEDATLRVFGRLVAANVLSVLPASAAGRAPSDQANAGEALAGTFLGQPPEPRPAVVGFGPDLEAPRPGRDATAIVTPGAVQYPAGPGSALGFLVFMREGGEAERALTRDSHSLGRQRNNDLVIADPSVSAYHARIDRTAEGFVVVDLESRNGTWVNGQRVDGRLLQDGDEIRLGGARMRFRAGASPS